MNNTYYLGVDLNLTQNVKVVKMMRKYGNEGFGIYVALELYLAQCNNHKANIEDIEDIAYNIRCEFSKLKSIIEDFDLFNFDKNIFFCTKVIERMQRIENLVEQRRNAGVKSGEARRKGTVVEQPLNESEATDEQGNVRKRNVRKRKEKKEKEILGENTSVTKGVENLDSLVSINWEHIRNKMTEDKTSEDYTNFIIGEYQSKEFLDIWEKFVSYRKMIKKPLVLEDQQTYHVLQLCKNGKWFKTSIAILELIIAKNWQWYKDEWIVNCGITLPERPYMGETEEEFTEEELAEAEEKIKNIFKK